MQRSAHHWNQSLSFNCSIVLLFACLLFLVGLSSRLSPVHGTILYVDANNGGDSSRGCTSEFPCSNVTVAYQVAADGDTILVRKGLYSCNSTLDVSISLNIVGESFEGLLGIIDPTVQPIFDCRDQVFLDLLTYRFTAPVLFNLVSSNPSVVVSLTNLTVIAARINAVFSHKIPVSSSSSSPSLHIRSSFFWGTTTSVECAFCAQFTIDQSFFWFNGMTFADSPLITAHETRSFEMRDSSFNYNENTRILLRSVTNGLIRNCEFLENTVFETGNLHVTHTRSTGIINMQFSSNITFDSCQWTSNSISMAGLDPAVGAAVALTDFSRNVSFTNCKFFNNTITLQTRNLAEGGAVFIEQASNITFNECIFYSNNATTGGAVQVSKFSQDIYFDSCDFYNNYAQSANYMSTFGGAVSIESMASAVVFSRCNFIDNGAQSGGAISVQQSPSFVMIQECFFYANNATGDGQYLNSGGAVVVIQSANVHIFNSIFFRNSAINGGNALAYHQNSNGALVSDSWFGENFPSIGLSNTEERISTGGAILFTGSSHGFVSGSTFVNNNAHYGGAISLELNSTDVSIYNCSFFENKVVFMGGAVYIEDSSGNDVTNSIFAYNIAQRDGSICAEVHNFDNNGDVVTQHCTTTLRMVQADENNCSPTEDCSGHGTCQPDGSCNCTTAFSADKGGGAWTGSSCATCSPNYFGPNCDIFCDPGQTCSGQGTCRSDGTCDCNWHRSGQNCQALNKPVFIAIGVVPPVTIALLVVSIVSTIVLTLVIKKAAAKIKIAALILTSKRSQIDNHILMEELVSEKRSVRTDLSESQIQMEELSKMNFLIPYSDLKLKERIGQGGFAIVFKGTLRDNTVVAIKTMKNRSLLMMDSQDSQGTNKFIAEITLWSRLLHPNIVRFMGACIDKENICIVSEYMEEGTLEQLLRAQPRRLTSWNKKIEICIDIATAMADLHARSPPILHRDLKPQNILLDKNLVAKISDFGLSKIVAEGSQTLSVAGTVSWMAPEVLRGERYGTSSDVYSFGLIMFVVLTERANPFQSDIRKLDFPPMHTLIDMHMHNTTTTTPSANSSSGRYNSTPSSSSSSRSRSSNTDRKSANNIKGTVLTTTESSSITQNLLDADDDDDDDDDAAAVVLLRNHIARYVELIQQCIAEAKDKRPSFDTVLKELHALK